MVRTSVFLGTRLSGVSPARLSALACDGLFAVRPGREGDVEIRLFAMRLSSARSQARHTEAMRDSAFEYERASVVLVRATCCSLVMGRGDGGRVSGGRRVRTCVEAGRTACLCSAAMRMRVTDVSTSVPPACVIDACRGGSA